MKKLIQLIVAAGIAAAVVSLSSCNTVRGMGEDVQHLGQSMQKAGS